MGNNGGAAVGSLFRNFWRDVRSPTTYIPLSINYADQEDLIAPTGSGTRAICPVRHVHPLSPIFTAPLVGRPPTYTHYIPYIYSIISGRAATNTHNIPYLSTT